MYYLMILSRCTTKAQISQKKSFKVDEIKSGFKGLHSAIQKFSSIFFSQHFSIIGCILVVIKYFYLLFKHLKCICKYVMSGFHKVGEKYKLPLFSFLCGPLFWGDIFPITFYGLYFSHHYIHIIILYFLIDLLCG